NYSFNYRYLYYFFVAKHIADKVDDNKEVIDSIIKNLHKDENAYIAIFVSHHSQKDYILDEIILNAYMLFDMYSSASLSKEELSFFDEQVDNIIKLVLPPSTSSPEIERDKRLKVQDKIEEDKSTDESKDDPTEDGTTPDDSPQNFELLLNLRRSIKTVEVMGRIIKNRAGSLERPRLEMIFEEAMNIHLRILTSFFDLIKNDDKQSKIIEFITKRLKIFTDAKKEKRRQEGQKEKEFSSEELEKLAKSIFWNTNFFVASGIIEKTVHSLGSDQLIDITEKVCNKIDSPATFLIKHGILMWYRKQLEVDKIEKKFKEKEFSETAKEILKFLIVEHCSIHKLTAQEKQTVESKLKISSKEMLLKQISNKE
ncbi:MAG: toll-Interleukin receptor, partial [Calditrichaeota bacterium]